VRGRDGCRVPLPWSGERPPYGFTTGDRTWLPQPADWARLSAQAEGGDAHSMLAFYRTALARRPRTLDTAAPLTWKRRDAVLDIVVAGDPGIRCIINLGAEPIELPAGDVLMTSEPVSAGRLAGDSAVWLSS
jgi:alpha-glucosidase